MDGGREGATYLSKSKIGSWISINVNTELGIPLGDIQVYVVVCVSLIRNIWISIQAWIACVRTRGSQKGQGGAKSCVNSSFICCVN